MEGKLEFVLTKKVKISLFDYEALFFYPPLIFGSTDLGIPANLITPWALLLLLH